MYFNYTKYIPIVFQLQNTNYLKIVKVTKYKTHFMYFKYVFQINDISITTTLFSGYGKVHVSQYSSLSDCKA